MPRVLYHWRMLETSAAGGGEEAKPWAFEAGHAGGAGPLRADRAAGPGRARPERPRRLPPRARARAASRRSASSSRPPATAARSASSRSSWSPTASAASSRPRPTTNYEIVVVADTSTEPEVLDELREIAGDRLRIVPYDRPFSFSAKINAGAVRAEGEHLLLLNDDIEVIAPDWIERMVMYSAAPGIGAVGGRLLVEDGRLQHVGVAVRERRAARAPLPRLRARLRRLLQQRPRRPEPARGDRRLPDDPARGVRGGRRAQHDFPVNYNDIDYCLKLRTRGLRVVYDPGTLLYHFESSSRSTEVEDWEKEMLIERWRPLIDPDPYSNPNLRYGTPRLSSPLKWAIRRFPRRPARGKATRTT